MSLGTEPVERGAESSPAYLAALIILRRLRQLGHQAYLAGGCVRDLLLGVQPKDFDVATSATPQAVQAAFARTEAVGAHFGVILVILEVDFVLKSETDFVLKTETDGWLEADVVPGSHPAGAQVNEPETDPGAAYATQPVPRNGRGLQASESLPAARSTARVVTEVATFRHDGAYSDGRRPDQVRFSNDPREDVLRRDFTINGLLLDALACAGELDSLRSDSLPREDAPTREPQQADLKSCVLDFVGGRADLEHRLVRAIGDPERRFIEDKLRMLRAVRFAARLNFEIEPQTLRAIVRQADQVGVVSAERVRDELTRILTEGHARRGFELLDESGLLIQVLPEIARMKGVEQPPQYHPEGDVWVHTLMLLDHLGADASPTLAWGMLLHDVGKPATFTAPDPGRPGDRIRFNGHADVGVAMARAILNRLRFSNDDADQILALVQHHMRFGDVTKMRESTLKRFLRLPGFDEHLALHRADVLSSHGLMGMYEFAKRRFEELSEEQIRPRLLLTGADLIAAGYRPGPQFRVMLEAAEDAQLEGAIASREEGLRLMQERFGPPR